MVSMTNDINLTLEGGVEGGITVEKDGSVFSDVGRLEFGDQGNISLSATETSNGIVELVFDTAGSNVFDYLELNAATATVKFIGRESDLPSASNGVRTLEDNTVYYFTGIVTTSDELELGNPSPLVGAHGGTSGIIYDGGGTMLTGADDHFFARDMLFSAPGGTVFDLTATQAYEILVESCSFADPLGMGDISSLGTIDGYRVPSFKGCNFEDFSDGLTFTGTPEKVFFETSPFRTVSSSGVTILEFDSSFEADIIDITDCYIKGVQSDTVVVRVDANAIINDVFQYRGVTHDSSVTKSNILTDAAGIGAVGYRIKDSYPLRDSGVTTSMYSTSSTAETVSGSGSSLTEITVPTDITNTERTSLSSNGIVQYDGKKDTNVRVTYSLSASGSNTEVRLVLFKNGTGITPAERAASRSTISNNSTPGSISVTDTVSMTTGDTLSAAIENIGGSGDIDVEDVSLVI